MTAGLKSLKPTVCLDRVTPALADGARVSRTVPLNLPWGSARVVPEARRVGGETHAERGTLHGFIL
jgi:hypothetical protein